MVMKRLIRCCAVLAVLPFFVACGENSPGTSVASESGLLLNQANQPLYIQEALVRAEQLSTRPGILVAICDADGKALGHADMRLAEFVQQCVENSGMD